MKSISSPAEATGGYILLRGHAARKTARAIRRGVRLMTEFFKGDIVRVEMPRGYTGRGLLSISLMFTTHPEAKFEGAVGTVTEINPVGPMTVHQYLVDFRTHDNSKIGIPWQAQWFREEWLALVEQASKVTV